VRSIRKSAVLGAAGTLTVPANPQRIAIMFAAGIVSASTAAAAFVSCESDFVHLLSTGQATLRMDMRDYGDMVQKAFTITNGTTANAVMTIVEFVAPEAALTSFPDDWNRK
jgi:hypothetical protein